MKEEERQLIIKKIEKTLQEEEKLNKKYEELKRLLENPEIKKYLALLNDINDIKRKTNRFTTKDELIKYNFIWSLNGTCKNEKLVNCTHDIWLYAGSYYYCEDPHGEHDHYYMTEDETDILFSHNEYFCLECGKIIETKNWKEFEETHYVLKNPNYYYSEVPCEYYQNIYYQLLFENSVSVSREIIINIFNNDTSKDKAKCKKNKNCQNE